MWNNYLVEKIKVLYSDDHQMIQELLELFLDAPQLWPLY